MTAGEPHGPDAHAIGRMTIWISGHVQGVGFRWWTRCRALELGLVGSATNLPDGRVEVLARGPRSACDALHHLLSVQPAPPVPQGAPRSYYRRPGVVTQAIKHWVLERGDEPPLTGFVER